MLYVGLKFRIYSFTNLAWWGSQGAVALFLISLPYIALCSWFSGLLDGAFSSLAICLLVTGFPVLFLSVASSTAGGDADWLMRVLPFGWKYDLLSGHLVTRVTGYLAMLGFTALFLTLGMRSFQKRDL